MWSILKQYNYLNNDVKTREIDITTLKKVKSDVMLGQYLQNE